MHGRGRVDGEAAGVADIGDMEEELQRVDERPPDFLAALQPLCRMIVSGRKLRLLGTG